MYFASMFVSFYWNHGLRMPNEAFFHRNDKLLGLGRQFGQINFGALGEFSYALSAPILILWVPCPCFPLINHYFYKKLSIYTQIPNIFLGLGFEFEHQRIRDIAIVSVVCDWYHCKLFFSSQNFAIKTMR